MKAETDSVNITFQASATHAADLTVDRPVHVQVTGLDGWLDEERAAEVGYKLKIIGEAMMRFAEEARGAKAAYRLSQRLNQQPKGTA